MLLLKLSLFLDAGVGMKGESSPSMLTVAKSSLTILTKSLKRRHDWENIWRRNVYQNITNNSHMFCSKVWKTIDEEMLIRTINNYPSNIL